MPVKAINFKNWCTDNISPQCWTRIVLKCMDIVRENGYTIKEMENPGTEIDLEPELLNALTHALDELYEVRVEENLLSLY